MTIHSILLGKRRKPASDTDILTPHFIPQYWKSNLEGKRDGEELRFECLGSYVMAAPLEIGTF